MPLRAQLETRKCGGVQKFPGLRALDGGVDGENNKAFLKSDVLLGLHLRRFTMYGKR